MGENKSDKGLIPKIHKQLIQLKKKKKKKGRSPKETFLQDTYFLVIYPVFHALIFVSPTVLFLLFNYRHVIGR